MIRRNIEVYVDDILVKFVRVEDLVADPDENFVTLCRYKIMLHPSKSIFGVKSGYFLGFLVTEQRIEANQEKV